VAALRVDIPTFMSPEQFARLEALYDEAAAVDPVERTRFIEERCSGDDELRRELLAAFQDAGSGLTGMVARAATAAAEAEDQWTGHRMGPYRIVRPLGRGGMGTVHLAVRDDDQFHKEVAIKTLKFELAGSTAVARFRHERQILANLEHANIARLLDGGTTEQGTPYIVLEYVEGVPLTEWCESQQLPTDQRLRLFRQICDAVQYAHQHLVVHRDIKPGNILVTPEGVPKLLDFGIAKLLPTGNTRGEESSTATVTGGVLMTPDYASPEQVRGGEISTATDVYSLGAVLYQLLTGQRPYTIQSYDPLEIARVVCESQIRPPSALGNRRLRGDLDVIVLKAMQKEPERRYRSVVEFSEDIRRHLEGLPIAARPDTLVYRATKFVRRHWVGVVAAFALVATLSAGIAVSLHEAQIAQRRFAQVRELANTFLFQFYDQVTPLAGSTAVRASIVETARKYLDGLAREAGNDTGLILELAQAYQRLGSVQARTGTANLGRVEDARASYKRSIGLYDRIPVNPQSPPELRRKMADVLFALARLEYNAYHEAAAEPINRRMLDLLGTQGLDPPTRKLRAMGEASLGQVHLKLGQPAEALTWLESSLKNFADLKESGYSDPTLGDAIATAQDHLAQVKVFLGDLDGAVAIYLDLLRTSKPCDEQSAPGAACRNLGYWLSHLADAYAAVDRPNLGEPRKAADLYERAVHIEERVAALDPQDRQARFDLAGRLGKLGDSVWKSDPARALVLYDRALTTARALASKEQFEMLKGSYLQAISRPLVALGRTAEARKALADSEAMDAAGPPHTDYSDLLSDVYGKLLWVPVLTAEGKRAEARHKLDEAIGASEKLRAGHRSDLTPVFYLSMAYREIARSSAGQERRDALLRSAAAWHSWPATSYTRREEQKDLAEAKRQ